MSFSNRYNSIISSTHTSRIWDVKSILCIQIKEDSEKYSFLILNTPIVNPNMIIPLWKKASIRFAVDGGGIHLYNALTKLKIDEIDDFLPNIVCGDFDSISQNVMQFYEKRNVNIIHTPNQDKTDFHKALDILSTFTLEKVLVYSDNVGRFDHLMGNINTLYKVPSYSHLKHLNVYLLGNDCLTWLLQPGYHTIHIPEKIWSNKSYCSLIPIGHPCCVSTTGLKWNLCNCVLKFGGLVSSSNTYDINQKETIVKINTDNSLIWSMTLGNDILNDV